MKKLYVGYDDKIITGTIQGIKKIEKRKDGVIITFHNEDYMHKASRVLMNSGYETVRKLGAFWFWRVKA